MAIDLFSPSWYRMADLKPRLRTHVHIYRQHHRDGQCYVIHDRVTGRFHRATSAAYTVIGLMDGRRTVQEIWDAATAQLGDDAPTQPDIVRLLGELYGANVLIADAAPDLADLARRFTTRRRRTRLARFANLFNWRLPLYDPDRVLAPWASALRPLLGWPAFVVWLLIVGVGLATAAVHGSALTHDLLDQLQTPRSLLLLWLLFPIIKLAHELGHAAVTKAFGGEVHELGITLLVLTPVPYVDASSAWAFTDKWQRIAVGAAGMMVELVLAAMALALWLNTEPGLVHTAAHQTILIAGVSTIAFNANPLLRFDGYYMLMDYLGIPNLRQRATRYIAYLLERYLCRAKDVEVPRTGPGERRWLLLYGVSSAIYRVIIIFAIVFFLGSWFPLLGLLFGLFALGGLIAVPLFRALAFLATSPRLDGIRLRAGISVASVVTLFVCTMALIPVPYQSVAEGVVRLPEETFVRAGMDGFVDTIVTQPGTAVRAGDILLICRNPELETELAVLEAKVQEADARRRAYEPTDRVKAALVDDELRYAKQDRDRVRERVEELTIRSRREGIFVAPLSVDWPGRFFHRGELLGHVVDPHSITVEGLVPQEEIDLVQHEIDHAEVRLAERLGDSLHADLTRIVPAASKDVPSPALTTAGGGNLPVDETEKDRLQAVQRLFQVDLSVAHGSSILNAGGRAYIRFTFHPQPLVVQWTRQLRQLFLARLHV